MKTRSYFQIIMASALLAFAGCQSFIANKTPAKIEANASDIYTFRVKVDETLRNVVPNTMKVDIVINGETHAMHRDTESGKYVWSFDYPVPSNVSLVPYYYIARFLAENDGYKTSEVVYSSDIDSYGKPYSSIISNRYVIKISSPRSPVGATIAIVGQGFTDGDRIIVGDTEAKTSLVSHSHISFIVPALPVSRTYKVSLRTAEGDLAAGTLHIDPSTIGVQPNSISIKAGESVPVTFFVDSPAPAGGLTIEVVTDVPASVVMPVVTIPEGQRSVSVSVQGAQQGKGFLFISAEGYDKAKIPVAVDAGADAAPTDAATAPAPAAAK
jgi:hypothetical protein